MNEIRVLPYDDKYRDEVLALTIAAWTPVFAKTALEVPPFAYEAFYPEGWQARQTSDVRALLSAEPGNIWLAFLAGELAGFIGIRLHPEDNMGEIYIVAVSPDLQRQGIGQRLMEHAESLIRAAGMKMVMVETTGDAGHEPARRTYEASGYVQWPVARYFKRLE